MKTIRTISWREAGSLTPVITDLQNKSGYIKTARTARFNTDTVFCLYNPNTGFGLEYTVKNIEGRERGFVNWARVSGPENIVSKFLQAVGIQESVKFTNSL